MYGDILVQQESEAFLHFLCVLFLKEFDQLIFFFLCKEGYPHDVRICGHHHITTGSMEYFPLGSIFGRVKAPATHTIIISA